MVSYWLTTGYVIFLNVVACSRLPGTCISNPGDFFEKKTSEGCTTFVCQQVGG